MKIHEKIMDAIAIEFEVTVDEILAYNRTYRVASARKLAMALVNKTNSLCGTAQIFNRSCAGSIVVAKRNLETQLTKDKYFRLQCSRVVQLLKTQKLL
jgi:chromosomal replication initiation ATPase DnaA